MIKGFKGAQDHLFLIFELPNEVLECHLGNRMNACDQITLLTTLKLYSELKGATMLFRLHTDQSLAHRNDIDHDRLLRLHNQSRVAARDELVELHLSGFDLVS